VRFGLRGIDQKRSVRTIHKQRQPNKSWLSLVLMGRLLGNDVEVSKGSGRPNDSLDRMQGRSATSSKDVVCNNQEQKFSF